MLGEYKPNEYAVFVRNDNDWGVKPKLSKVIVKVIPDGETAAAALEKGDIDMIYGSGILSIDTFNELKKNDQLQALQSGPMTTRVIGINSNRGAAKDLAVRLALEYGVDKQTIVDHILYGTEKKADALFAETFPYCRLGLEARNFDETKAAKYLEDAGWKLSGGKEYREKDGRTLEMNLCFIADESINKSIAEDLQAEYKKIGIKIDLIGEESNSFYDRQKSGDFDLIFGESWGAPYDPHSYVSSFREPSHFDYQAQLGLPMKKNIDEAISQVLISTDETTRQELYASILQTLHEQAVYLPISYRTNVAVANKKVTGDEPLSSLDVSVQAQILNLLADLKEEFNLSYLFISHDIESVYYLSDSLAVMYLGRIVEYIDDISLFDNLRHPYTRKLLSSVLISDPKQRQAFTCQQGDGEKPGFPSSGCPYFPRCLKSKSECRKTVPEIKQLSAHHFIACHG